MSFILEGGAPYESITLDQRVFFPGESMPYYADSVKKSNGNHFGIFWTDGINSQAGTLTIKIYNKETGAYLGEGSIELH